MSESVLTCAKCGATRPATAEYFCKDGRDPSRPLARRCRECQRKACRIGNARARHHRPAYITRIVSGVKCRAARRGIPTDIDAKFIAELFESQRGMCALSGRAMTTESSATMHCSPTNISIDRIDPSQGYTRTNVQLVCFIVNCMKNELSLDDMITWCESIITHNKPSKVTTHES